MCVCVCVCVCVYIMYIYTYIRICICIYTHSGILLTIIKNEILSFAMMWIELESIMLSETSQSEKDKYHTISLLCRI